MTFYFLLLVFFFGDLESCEVSKLFIYWQLLIKMDKIIDGIYLGDIRAAANLFLLK